MGNSDHGTTYMYMYCHGRSFPSSPPSLTTHTTPSRSLLVDAEDADLCRRTTLHPTPYTLHSTPSTLLPTPFTLHPTLSNLHLTPYTLRSAPYTLHPWMGDLCRRTASPPLCFFESRPAHTHAKRSRSRTTSLWRETPTRGTLRTVVDFECPPPQELSHLLFVWIGKAPLMEGGAPLTGVPRS